MIPPNSNKRKVCHTDRHKLCNFYYLNNKYIHFTAKPDGHDSNSEPTINAPCVQKWSKGRLEVPNNYGKRLFK